VEDILAGFQAGAGRGTAGRAAGAAGAIGQSPRVRDGEEYRVRGVAIANHGGGLQFCGTTG